MMGRGIFLAMTFVIGLAGIGYALAAMFAPAPWKLFINTYVSFFLPDNWICEAEGTEFVCRSSSVEEAKRSIFVLTAKYLGPNDNFEYYDKYLRAPKTPAAGNSSAGVPSTLESISYREIEGHVWLVAVHDGSLIPSYRSYYYVTIYKNISVLITYSHHLEAARYLSNIGERAAASLVVFN
jgi:hypothetical protein